MIRRESVKSIKRDTTDLNIFASPAKHDPTTLKIAIASHFLFASRADYSERTFFARFRSQRLVETARKFREDWRRQRGGIFNMKMTFYVFNDDRPEPPHVRCEIDKLRVNRATANKTTTRYCLLMVERIFSR